MEITPHGWILIKARKDGKDYFRVFTALDNEWRLSSGVTNIRKDGDHIYLTTSSGNRYKCHLDNYNTLSDSYAATLNNLIETNEQDDFLIPLIVPIIEY